LSSPKPKPAIGNCTDTTEAQPDRPSPKPPSLHRPATNPQASRTTAASPTAAATKRREDHQRLDHHRSYLYNRQIGCREEERTTNQSRKTDSRIDPEGEKKIKIDHLLCFFSCR